MTDWKLNIEKTCTCLMNLSVSDQNGNELSADIGFSQWMDACQKIRSNRKRLFLVGNGASASMASHFAADLAKNAGILTEVFFDLSLLTALGNDIAYEAVFSEPIKWKLAKDDMLVAISSSGNSPNIVKGVEQAIIGGGRVVTLSAMSADNAIRKIGHLNFYIPATTYGLAESCHAIILHHWTDMIISQLKSEA